MLSADNFCQARQNVGPDLDPNYTQQKSKGNLRKPWNKRTPKQTIIQILFICLDTFRRLKKNASSNTLVVALCQVA